MELRDRGDVEDIIRSAKEGMERGVWPPLEGLLCIYFGELRLESYRNGARREAYCIDWVEEGLFEVTAKQGKRLRFSSLELEEKLLSLARQHSIRTWDGSNPEFFPPEQD